MFPALHGNFMAAYMDILLPIYLKLLQTSPPTALRCRHWPHTKYELGDSDVGILVLEGKRWAAVFQQLRH